MTDTNDKRCWVGFDLGGTKMMAAVFDDKMNVIGRKRKRTRSEKRNRSTQERIVESIHVALKNAKRSPADIAGIGMGCPGPLDLNNRMVLEAVNLGWRNEPIGDYLEKEFKCPVVIANDVDIGVYGEYRFGSGRGARTVVGIFPGTGIGGGCVYDGRILRGSTSSCMEIGHMQVIPHGSLCGCGQYGCLETVASRLAVAADAAKAVYRGEAPHLKELTGADLTNIRSGQLAAAIAAGDKAIEAILLNAAHHLGVAVANLVSLLLPDIVVLGGGLVEAMPKIMVPAVEKAARKHVMSSFANQFEVAAAKLGDDAGIMGAAAWARATFETPAITNSDASAAQ